MRMIEDLCDRAFDAVSYGFWIATARSDASESAAMRDAARDEFSQLLARLEQELGDREFFCGGSISRPTTCSRSGANSNGPVRPYRPDPAAATVRSNTVPTRPHNR